MRGLKRMRSAAVIGAGHAFVQTCAADITNSQSTKIRKDRLAVAFTELAAAI
jgi:hypothetical protein